MLTRLQNSYPETGCAGLNSHGVPYLWLHVLPSPPGLWRSKCWCLKPGTHPASGDGISELPLQDREEKPADFATSPAPRLGFVTLQVGLSPESLAAAARKRGGQTPVGPQCGAVSPLSCVPEADWDFLCPCSSSSNSSFDGSSIMPGQR